MEVELKSVLNEPQSYYVYNSKVSAGGAPGDEMYVNIYEVSEGITYYVKSLNGWHPSSTSTLSIPVDISFGTNLLNDTGEIVNCQLIKSINTSDESLQPFTIEFTPNQNGYIYMTEVNVPEYKVKCLTSLFIHS